VKEGIGKSGKDVSLEHPSDSIDRFLSKKPVVLALPALFD
jgi:hypothetical protein